MKKLFLSSLAFASLVGPAMAADMYVKAAPLPPPCIWCGWYVGVNGGGGYAESNGFVGTETFNGTPFVSGTWPGAGNFGSLSPSGGFGGGQAGYNWQTGALVFGVEADIEGSGIRGSAGGTLPYIATPSTVTQTLTSNLDWFGTFRGRLGYSWGNLLLFATGGLAYGEVKTGFTYTDTLGFSGFTNQSSTRTGYVVGAGLEYAITRNWSAKFEYQYMDLGSTGLGLTEFLAGAPTAFADQTNASFKYNTFRGGLNFRF